MPKRVFEFKYGLKLRGAGPGCQPKKGFLRIADKTAKKRIDKDGEYLDIVFYSRRLTDKEISDFELADLNKPASSRLSKMREIAGYRQAELSEKTGISIRTIQKLEFEGMEGCALSTAVKLAETLKCNVTDFLDKN